MPRVLVIEDDPAVRDVVEYALSREGMKTVTVGTGEDAAKHLFSSTSFDLVILDLMLPDKDGVTLCRELRAAGPPNGDIPVIMLTARDDETSVVVGLEVGADDYVTKPFSPRQLVSRVRAQLRRRELDARNPGRRLELPGLAIDTARREVIADGAKVELTASEFEILAFLASRPGEVYSRDEIMSHLWNGDFYGETRAADVHIQHIRKKVEPDPKNPRYIQTVRGTGYRFADLREPDS